MRSLLKKSGSDEFQKALLHELMNCQSSEAENEESKQGDPLGCNLGTNISSQRSDDCKLGT